MRKVLLKDRTALVLIGVIGVQSLCAIYFALDVLTDYQESAPGQRLHLYVESIATLVLLFAVFIESRQLLLLLRSRAHLTDRLKQSSMTLHEIIEDSFSRWSLSPAEYDVAMFAVKGLGVSEISAIRGRSEGTVKAQLSAVYRKAGVQNRAELLTAIIDTLYDRSVEG